MKKLFETYPDFKKLDYYSKSMLKKFARTYPHWVNRATIETDHPDTETYYLVITVLAPKGDRSIRIATDWGRITVGFDAYHAHFGGWQGISKDEAFNSAKNFIDAILNEQVVVCIKMDNDQWAGSRWYPPEMLNSIPADQCTYTRSWLGTYDHHF